MTSVHLMAHRAFLGGGDRRPSTASVVAALFAGAACGGLGVVLIFAVPSVGTAVLEVSALDLSFVPFVFIVASLLVGVLIVAAGGPCWWLLHVLRVRGWASATLLGVVLSTVFFATGGSRGMFYSLQVLLVNSAFIVLAGFIGWVIWKVAYDTSLARAPFSDLADA